MDKLNYLDWVSNEYNLWSNFLQKCKGDNFLNFKSQEQIIRMVGASSLEGLFSSRLQDYGFRWEEIEQIDNIGNPPQTENIGNSKISTITLRYLYYANIILDKIKENSEIRIVEIGGGYGGFCSIMDYLANFRRIKIDHYSIYDLPGVQSFQKYYLNEVIDFNKEFGIKNLGFLDSQNLNLFTNDHNYLISFYALGEFDEKTKYNYIDKVVSKVDHGFILWNPHLDHDPIGEEMLRKYHPYLKMKKEDPETSSFNMEIIF